MFPSPTVEYYEKLDIFKQTRHCDLVVVSSINALTHISMSFTPFRLIKISASENRKSLFLWP